MQLQAQISVSEMSLAPSASRADLEQAAQFAAEWQQLTQPLATLSGFAYDFEPVASGQWSVVSGQATGNSGQWSVVSGQATGNSGQAIEDEEQKPEAERGASAAACCSEVIFEGRKLGVVRVTGAGLPTDAPRALAALTETVLERLAARVELEALLEELSLSWESLEAMYKFGTDWLTLQRPDELLCKITERLGAVHTDLCAALWLEREGQLRPAGLFNFNFTRPVSRERGVIGRVMDEGLTLVFNQTRNLMEIDGGLEPFLREAQRVCAIPIATAQTRYGVMTVWHNQESGVLFDSRLVRLFEALAQQAAMVLENEKLYRQTLESERLRQELEIGSEIQQTLLVGQLPRGLRGVELAARSVPSQKIDGDFYDFIEYSEECFDLIVGDVMGKGIPAALVGAATKNNFLRALADAQNGPLNSRRPAPADIVRWVNHEMTSKLISLESFVTLCYARFDLAHNRLELLDCGHTRAVYLRQRTGQCELLEGYNMPLGFSPHEVFQTRTLTFEPGDYFLFYSDGVTEAANPSGELFGEERLQTCVRRFAHLPPEQLLTGLQRELNAFTQQEVFRDDVTCIALRAEGRDQYAYTEANTRFNSNLYELARLRAFLDNAAQWLLPQPAPENWRAELVLAANEAFTNIACHAYAGRTDGKIEAVITAYAHRLVCDLHHWGAAFENPEEAPPPVFDGSQEGGFGLFIIAQSVDEVAYARDETGRNTIRLIKNTIYQEAPQ